MANTKKEFLQSLDLPDQEVEQYIPAILEDLWELGSMPEYIIRLVKENIDRSSIYQITDFGCGKGAVLIKLAQEINFNGVGIDIVPQFIEAAQQYARQYLVSDRIQFITSDITEYLAQIRNKDLVIYGHDSAVLGNIQESLHQLENCLFRKGWVILEIAYTPDGTDSIEGLPTQSEAYSQLTSSHFVLVDEIIWDTDELRKVNEHNNKLIQARIQKLIAQYPDKEALFNRYMQNQVAECRLLETHMSCSTWLLRKIS